MSRFYESDNANPAAALHTLARRSAEQYGAARATVARFLNASAASEVVFTKGTTEAINLVASTWGAANITRGDEIVLSIAEHYSNLLPWRAVAERAGARVVVVDVDDQGRLTPERVVAAFTSRTKLLAFSHVSNVLGLVAPAEELCRLARARNVAVLVDAAQSAPHRRIDVQALGCDFLACSGHKLLGPMGTGVLWAKQATLDAMPAYQLGSNMAHEVDAASAQFEHGALKYQAGTPNVSGAVGSGGRARHTGSLRPGGHRPARLRAGRPLPRARRHRAGPSRPRHAGRSRTHACRSSPSRWPACRSRRS